MGRFIASDTGTCAVRDASVPRYRGTRPHDFYFLLSSACTSPLVGRRDPLGVGLRPGMMPVSRRGLSRVVGQTAGCLAGCLAVLARYRAADIKTASGPPQARSVYTRIHGPSAVTAPDQLLVWRCSGTGSIIKL